VTALLTSSCTATINFQEVTPRSGSITLDETKEYASGLLVLPWTNPDDGERIDPRADQRAVVTLNGRRFNLGVRSRSIDHKAKTVTVGLASDEMLLVDYAPLADINLSGSAGSVRSIINYVLNLVIPGSGLNPTPANNGAVAETDAAIWRAGMNAWDFLLELTSAVKLRLFCDELRVWRLVPQAYMVDGVVVGTPSNVTEGDDTIDRDGDLYADGVVVRYRWTDSSGAHERIDAAGNPGKLVTIEVTSAYPGPGAAAFALNRLRGQGRMQNVTALVDANATPGMELRVSLPGANDQIGRLQAVTFEVGGVLMPIKGRALTDTPPTAYIFGAPGKRYVDVPAGMTYDTFDWSAF
jgi:hypothetical protein